MFEEHQDDLALAFEELIEAEEAKGNFIFDEVPTGDPPGQPVLPRPDTTTPL